MKFVSCAEVVSDNFDLVIEVTHTSDICPPNLRPLHGSFDVIPYLCFAWESGQRGWKSAFDVIVCIPHVREGNAAELQVSGLVLAARVVEWKLHIRSAPPSPTGFCADFAVADACRAVDTHLEAKRVFILTCKQSVTRTRRGRLLYFGIGKDGQNFIEQLLQWISAYSVMERRTQ